MQDDILSDLFSFPIIVADGEVERKKIEWRKKKEERFGSMNINSEQQEEEPMETVVAMADFPFTYFIGVAERWQPNDESFNKAKEGDFDACSVVFANLGTYIVPWTKEKFKREYSEFVRDYNRKLKEKKEQEQEKLLMEKKNEVHQIPIVILGQKIEDEQQ